MSAAAIQPRRGRLSRILRRCRIAAVFATLLVVGALGWLTQVGLPGPLTDLLRAELQQRGAEATFSRIRWRPGLGLVADGLALRQPGDQGIQVRFREVVLDVSWRRLLAGEPRLTALALSGGQLVVPLATTESPAGPFTIEELSAQIRFRPGDCWEITAAQGRAFNCDLRLAGTVTNVTAWRRPPDTEPPADALAFWRAHLREVQAVARQLVLEPRPTFEVRFRGDAADPATMRVAVRLSSPRLNSPWGSWEGLRLAVRLNEAPLTNAAYHARLELGVQTARTLWATLTDLDLTVDIAQPATNPVPARVLWRLSSGRLEGVGWGLAQGLLHGDSRREAGASSRWIHDLEGETLALETPRGGVLSNRFSGRLAMDLARPFRPVVTAAGRLQGLESPWGKAEEAVISADWEPVSAAPSLDPAEWGPWLPWAEWAGTAAVQVSGIDSPRIQVPHVELEARWRPPRFELPRLAVRLYDGTLEVSDLDLEVPSRALGLGLDSRFDVHRLRGVLPESASDWLGQFGWESPPWARARVDVVLPPWSTALTDPVTNLLSTLRVDGSVEGERASYRGVAFDRARLQVRVADGTLRLRDLRLVRPEGEADLDYTLGLLSRQFRWDLTCRLNPPAVAPAVDDELPKILSLFTFTNAAFAQGWVTGSFQPPRRTELSLAIEARDFLFRGESWDRLSGQLELSNQVLIATDARARTGGEWAAVEWLAYDTVGRRLSLTNARSHLDPQRAARAIGPEVESVLAPYEFGHPPQIHLGGSLPTTGELGGADMRFDIAGGPFHFWRFDFTDVQGGVHWRGDRVVVTNFSGGFYEGRLMGDLVADLSGGGSPNLSFDTRIEQVSLRPAIADIFSLTNHIQGIVSGEVVVTNGRPDELESWYGHGQFEMKNGLLWNLPVFGVVSRALNAISPDLGNNRAHAARGIFALSGGVLETADLRIETGPARLHYQGECSLTGEIEARVTAEVFRSTPVVGPLISLVLTPMAKAFELEVSGNLADPDVELRYVSKLVAPLFDPVGTLKSIFEPRPVRPEPPPSNPD